jgi:hypothetical protein
MTCLIRPPALQPSIHLISFQQGRVRSGTTRSKAKQSKANQSKAKQSSTFPPCIPWRASPCFSLPCLDTSRSPASRLIARACVRACVHACVHVLARFLWCVQHRDRIGSAALGW